MEANSEKKSPATIATSLPSEQSPPQANNSVPQEYATSVTMTGDVTPKNPDVPPEYATAVTMAGNKQEAEKQSEPVHETAMTMAGKGTQVMKRQYLFETGETLGKYKIEATLGKGGMGEVYLSRHTALEVTRAIKVLPQEISARDKQFAERFLREAKLACSIRNANVVNVMDVETDTERGISYIVMEYVDGGTVRDALRAHKRLSEEQALVIVTAVAEALAAAAEFKIVHRDIKPDNIMLTKRGEVKLADLGIAKTTADDVSLTMSNVMMGTPAYLSPEQAKDAKNVDVRADIYSLGATLYEMLTGQVPYTGSSAYDILTKLVSEPVPDPRAINPAITAATAKLTMKMLDKNPAHRPSDANELLKELENIGGAAKRGPEAQRLIREALSKAIGETLITPISTVKNKTIAGRLKSPSIIAATALLLVVIATGTCWHFLHKSPTQQEAPNAKPPEPAKPATVQTNIPAQPAATTQNGQIKPQSTTAAAKPPEVPKTGKVPAGKPVAITKKPALPPGNPASKNVECQWQIFPPGAKLVVRSTTGAGYLETTVPGNGRVNFVLDPGIYQAYITHTGFNSQTLLVNAIENTPCNNEVVLIEHQGGLYIRTQPNANVKIFRNAEKVHEGDADARGLFGIKAISIGEYNLEITSSGYQKASRNIVVRNMTDCKLEVPLEKVQGNGEGGQQQQQSGRLQW